MAVAPDEYRTIFEAASDGLILTDVESGCVVAANPAAAAMHGYPREEFIGLDPAVYLHPDSQSPFQADVASTRQGNPAEGLAIHLRRDKSPFYVEARRSAVTFRGRACLLSVIRDVDRRIQAELLLRQRVEGHAREQSILLEVSQTLASTLELRPGLILDQLRKIVEYVHAGLFRVEDTELIALAVRGLPSLEQVAPFPIPMDDPESMLRLFAGDKPVRISDMACGDPAADMLRTLFADQAAPLITGMRSWIWVPIAIEGRVIGGMGLAHDIPDYYTAHHANLALTVANQAATTMVNAELYEHAQALAALHERQRLAQELHDAVNQSLFSAGLIAEVLPRLWEQDVDEGRRSLEDLRRLTRGALAEMRMLLVELRPSALTDGELGDLLRLLGNALTGRANIPVTVTISGQGALPAEVQVAFYRLCQEGLNNIARHSQATQVEIRLMFSMEPSAVELQIRDNGRGFDPGQIPTGHFGLSMMRERAEAAGTMLSVASRPGFGTEITVRWPNAPEQEVS